MTSIKCIFDKIIEKNVRINQELVQLKELDWNNINGSEKVIEELGKLSNTIDEISFIIDNFKDTIIENTIVLNKKELKLLRDIKIDRYIQKTFLPLMMYLKICIQNNIVNID